VARRRRVLAVNAAGWRKFHATMAIAWIFPGVVLAWFIVYQITDPRLAAFAILVVSLYANAATHWTGYQAARAESAADPTDQSVGPSQAEQDDGSS
jgi:hypothetical protein